jgi:NADPH-dependent 2,4-dienoyl-CoA reductase/sulfur reductase-like enzyme/nitrite reductase/ring-hydroxylating ferredoxin subunit
MSGERETQGPDLKAGIDEAELAPTDPSSGQILGHVDGEAVLLVRQGGEDFAIGATCTHYGGPLAEGLVVGDTVRCPWHHACFSLRTGAALRAPALNPVACYRVERQGDRIFVREKLPAPAPATDQKPDDGPSSVVIVGGGAAGNAAAERLRELGYGGPITLISADRSLPNLSKDYLAGNAPEEWIPLRSKEFYDERRIEVRLGVRVTAIDPRKRSVTLEDGTTLPYGALLLATGASPIRLNIPGADRPHVHYLRSLADSRAIVAAVTSEAAEGAAKRAVVLGASFIGLEVAAALRARGVAVTIAAPEDRPLGRILGPDLGDFVRSLHEEHGVVFRLGKKAAEIGEHEVRLENGETLPADLVIAGIGVRPNLDLARAAGLQVEDGVVVDENLETSVLGIFAAGDIARWPDAYQGEPIRVEHWVVAERQGQAAVVNLLGRPGDRQPFRDVPFFWSQHYDVQISYVGSGKGWEEAELSGSLAKRDATVTYRKKGRIVAVATLFRDRQSLQAELAMERGDEAKLKEVVGEAAGSGLM